MKGRFDSEYSAWESLLTKDLTEGWRKDAPTKSFTADASELDHLGHDPKCPKCQKPIKYTKELDKKYSDDADKASKYFLPNKEKSSDGQEALKACASRHPSFLEEEWSIVKRTIKFTLIALAVILPGTIFTVPAIILWLHKTK